MFILGTRPEVIKLSPIIKAFQSPTYKKIIELIIVSTGQHTSMLDQTLDVFNIHPTVNLTVMKPGQNLSQLTSNLLTQLDFTMSTFVPDLVIVQGDTSSAFAGSLAAFYNQIPVAHVEAGLRTWNIKYPYPEEFDRQAIGIVAKYHFAATLWAKNNLLKEGKMPNSIYITGNPVVDSLFSILNTTKPTDFINFIQKAIKKLVNHDPEIILFTTHRRENQGDIMKGFFEAIIKILKNAPNVIIIFPMHKNPKVYEAFASTIPPDIISSLRNHATIYHKEWKHINRLILIEPMNYIDLVHLMNMCTLVLTDSGGLQEESTSLGKPVLILRTTTERPEAILAGNAILVGYDKQKIYSTVMDFLTNSEKRKKMCHINLIYGDGTAGIKIANIIMEELMKNDDKTFPTGSTLSHSFLNNPNSFFNHCIDLIIVITVWKRETLHFQLGLIYNQTALSNKKVEIIIFQNANHINIDTIIYQWTQIFNERKIKLTYIHSSIETGYYGRFLVPLVVDSCPESYFIINDDDITFGARYYENMLRVVNDGFLCTRNGRAFTKIKNGYLESCSTIVDTENMNHITYEHDIDVDFGGHVWAGKIKWLKKVWKTPPLSFANCEDFWLSAILKTQYNIGTKIPKCPKPRNGYNMYGELCACSIPTALNHFNAELGGQTIKDDWNYRHNMMNEMINVFKFSPLQNESIEKYNLFINYGTKHLQKVFQPSQWSENCLFWF